MKKLDNGSNLEQWQLLIERGDDIKLLDELTEAPAIDVSEFLSKQDLVILLRVLSMLKGERRSEIFYNLEENKKREVYHSIPKQAIADIFFHMASVNRVDFYQTLSDKEKIKILPYLKKKVREDLITLSSYLPSTAGGIMSTDFATVQKDMSVKEAFEKLKEDSPSKKMIYYLYVLNSDFKLIGIVSLKDLVMAEMTDIVETLIFENFIFARVEDDQEEVAKKIEKYDLAAIPILNEDDQLVGIVSYDEAMDVIRAEHTEDMEKFMGIVSDEGELGYLQTSSIKHFRKRVSWIVGLFIVSFISGAIIHKYEPFFARFTILATYIPSITDAGGNAGSQAATVVIRAMSLGQLKLGNWIRIIWKETKVALLLAVCLFLLAFLKVLILSSNKTYDSLSLNKIAFVISLALSLQVIASTVIGATLPLIAKFFKGDPAVAASPAITTLVDITGMLIYFSLCMYFLIK